MVQSSGGLGAVAAANPVAQAGVNGLLL
jgi:hypothetical protein